MKHCIHNTFCLFFVCFFLCNLSLADPITTPDDDTEWSIYFRGCIQWETSGLTGDVGTISVEYGESFAFETEIVSGYNLNLGHHNWIVHGVFPSTARIKISYDDGTGSFLSEEFQIRSSQTQIIGTCSS